MDALLQVDIFHPLASLHWEKCAPLPEDVYGADCVAWNDSVWVKGHYTTKLFKSSAGLNSWTALTTPTYDYALTSYHSQLVLVGGKETGTDHVTNKLWTSETGMDWQPSVLPPMHTRRYGSSAANTGTPECLVVVGGREADHSELDTVEVLVQDQWSAVQPLPRKCSRMKSALYNGKLYFMGGDRQDHDIYYCEVNSHSLSQWSQFRGPSVSENSSPASFGQQLIAISGSKIHAHSSLTQSWVNVGETPSDVHYAAPVVLPAGQLVVVDTNFGKSEVFRGSLRGAE